MIRSFIAIELPEETRQTLAHIQEHLKKSGAGVRWVNPSSIHLTLKFLGHIHPAQVKEIAAASAKVVRDQPILTLSAAGLACFPNQRNPRVIWIGVYGETEMLGRIQSRLEDQLEPLGFAREQRNFRPHLTIGRVKTSRNRQALLEAMTSLKSPKFNSFDVTEIILYKSDLRPTGAIYTKLHRMPLAAPAPPKTTSN